MRLNWMEYLILAFCVSMVSGQSRKIARYSPAPDVIYYGEVRGNTIHQLRNDIGEIAEGKYAFTGTKHALDAVRLLPPVVPSKIICFGWTFPSHAKEVGGEAHRKEPLVFLKPPTVLIADKDTIVLPKGLSEQVEFEGELAVVIGKKSRNLDVEEAMGAVMAVTCFNDVTARDLTKKDPEFTRGKGFDTFGPLGPWMVTGIDPQDLRLQTIVNGKVRQDARISEMTFEIPFLISYISQVMTLLPGDVIAFGTPGGSGRLESGDVVQIKIEGIGTLTNPVK